MDLTVFSNLNVMWTRWSEYTLTTCEMSGPHISYLVPAPGAAQLQFNCAEHPEQLVSEALELGRQLVSGTSDQDRLYAAFAARHGLLGLEADKVQPMRMTRTCPRIAAR